MSLIADLDRLGESLAAADLPSDARKILGALVRYVETGSLDPVTYETPAESRVEDEKQAEIARLADRVATLEAEQTAQSPSAPAPAAPSPEAPAGAGGVLPPPSAPAEPAPDQPPEAPAASA
jgi:hypothetical protein